MELVESSIEVLVIENADYILMQNWMHLTHVMKHFNLQPREAHDCDFSRVREWAAEGRSKYYRQTILLSHTPNKLENLLLFQNSFNHRGWIELKSKNSNSQLANIPQPVPQLFHRLRLGFSKKCIFKIKLDASSRWSSSIMLQAERTQL